jgi:hypothetical protein
MEVAGIEPAQGPAVHARPPANAELALKARLEQKLDASIQVRRRPDGPDVLGDLRPEALRLVYARAATERSVDLGLSGEDARHRRLFRF